MAHLGARAFDSIGGEVVSTTAFILSNSYNHEHQGYFFRLVDAESELEKANLMQEAIRNPDCGWFYRASDADFKKIPGSAIASWVSDKIKEIFLNNDSLISLGKIGKGSDTGDNDLFIRKWH